MRTRIGLSSPLGTHEATGCVLVALDEGPHIEVTMPEAENPDRSIRLRCTLCETSAAFDSDGMAQESVRERLVSFAMEHEACPHAALPTARELARLVEQDPAVLAQRRRVEAIEEDARGLALECERTGFVGFGEWQKADRMARAARAQLTAERLAVQRRILDETRARLRDAVERNADRIREIA